MNEQVSSVQMGQIHGITELVSLERTSGDNWVQLFKTKSARGFARDLVQSGFEYSQALKQILFHFTDSQVSEKIDLSFWLCKSWVMESELQ